MSGGATVATLGLSTSTRCDEGHPEIRVSPARGKSEHVDERAAIGRKAPVAIHTVSSQFASATSTCVFYPFDVLKTRFMSQDGTQQRQHNGHTYNSIIKSLQTIRREEGIRTLFRGCSVAVFGAITAWGMYMGLYRYLCNLTESTSYVGRSTISIMASLISSLLSCPIFLIKSRMQLEEATRSSHYRTFSGGLRHAVATSGIRSLWRGASLQMMLVFPNALSLPTYDFLKSRILHYHWDKGAGVARDLSLMEVCVCSAVTKVFLAVLSHPLVMLRTRLQDQRARVGKIQYRTLPQTISTVLRTQGVRGLYRGFSTTLAHSLPRSLLHYLLYEKTLNLLCHTYSYERTK